MKSHFIFFGTSAFAVIILDELLGRGMTPSLVVTTPDKPAGRGLRPTPSPVKTWAEAHRIPVFEPATLKTPDAAERLAAEHADVFIVAAYGKLLPRTVLEIPAHDVLNVHPSLLPRWRGADPIRAAILAGDAMTGVSIMQLDEEMDHGPILAQRETPIGEKNYADLEMELAHLGGRLLAETLPRWLAGAVSPHEQNHAEATLTKKITKEDGHLTWNEPAEVILRKIRALNPWPGTYAFWKRGEKTLRLRILKAHLSKVQPWKVIHSQSASWRTTSGRVPGTIIHADDELAVSCADGAILIETLQLEGKKAMPSAEFARGYPDIVGAILT